MQLSVMRGSAASSGGSPSGQSNPAATRSNLDAHEMVQTFYSIPLARALLVNSAWSAVKANHKETSATNTQLNEVYRLWARTLKQSVLPFLKAGDDALVRLCPTSDTEARRDILQKAGFDPVLIHILKLQVEGDETKQVLALKALAVEAMSHMARSSSKHRSRLGAKGGVSVLFPLLKLPLTATAACEGLWVLCFDSADNVRYISRPGTAGQAALEDLVSVLCDAAQPKRARMFAAAALQNLAGDIHDSNDASGYKTYDGAKVRALLNKEEVLQTLVYLAWTGPCVTPDLLTQCKEGDAAEGYEAIVAWAAAGVIANLAMEPDVPKKLVQAGAMEGLLGLMASPDWLESLQATKALMNIVNDPVVKLSIMDWFSLVHTTLDPMVMNRLYAIGQGTMTLNDQPTRVHREEAKHVVDRLFAIFDASGKLDMALYDVGGDQGDGGASATCVVA